MPQPREHRETYSPAPSFPRPKRRHRLSYQTRVLLTIGLVGLFLLIALLTWAAIDVLLLTFLGVLLAIALRTLANPLARKTPLSPRWALAVIVLLLVAIFAGLGWFLVPELINQAEELVDQVRNAIGQLETLARNQFGQDGVSTILEDGSQWLSPSNLLPQLMNTFTVTLEVLANALFVVFIGLFVAFDPHLYRNGIVSLVPRSGRQRAREVIKGVVQGLKAWLLGRIISMLVIGVVVSLGLWLLGMPLALVLGLIAALAEFIPVVGPILAAVPGVLIAFTQSPTQAVYVALFYLVVQQLEGNILTPIVQQQVVSLPPVLGLSTVLALGLLFGPLGILVATPLTVVVFILVRMIYVQDILEARPDGQP